MEGRLFLSRSLSKAFINRALYACFESSTVQNLLLVLAIGVCISSFAAAGNNKTMCVFISYLYHYN